MARTWKKTDIKLGKSYVTVDGGKCRIICVDATPTRHQGSDTILGLVYKGGEQVIRYFGDGSTHQGVGFHLCNQEWKEPVVPDIRWFGLYPQGSTSWYLLPRRKEDGQKNRADAVLGHSNIDTKNLKAVLVSIDINDPELAWPVY